ncbi:MAG: hypothetical protein PHC34_00775 [Candidatus Gastranaerophilales bacterium]|nr:hypothetical protein [Candidatus Gastranaerophilales bacterium]
MININLFIIMGIVINLILIAGFIFGKKIIKNQTTSEFNSKYGICLTIVFSAYLISLITIIIVAFMHNLYSFGLILSLFLISPFIIGNLATFEKAGFYVNIQILVLFASFFIITSMIVPLQTQDTKLSDNNIQKPALSNQLLSRHEILSRFKKSICSMVRPYNQVFKRVVKIKNN